MRNVFATIVGTVADFAVATLFFLHGARLSRTAIAKGTSKWRLHLLVLVSTYALFPALGLLIAHFAKGGFDPLLLAGLIYLTLLPSTVQSSVAFTALARGDVVAAMCSASLSNLAGIFVTPFFVGMIMAQGHAATANSAGSVGIIVVQLLLPFLAGHLLRPWIGAWLERRKSMLQLVDRGSILLVIYAAFSAAVVMGIWQRVGLPELAGLLGLSVAILTIILTVNALAARLMKLPHEDAIVLLFCGSKKSLVSGIPMAAALFDPMQVGIVVLPLMIFHQVQLFACAALAGRFRRRSDEISAPRVERAAPRVRVPITDGEIAEAAAAAGMTIPLACLPGIGANLALLDRHTGILRGQGGGAR